MDTARAHLIHSTHETENTMAKYRKKHVEIEAMQFAGSPADAHDLTAWMERNRYPFLVGNVDRASDSPLPRPVGRDDSTPDKGIYIDPATGELMIRTLEGDMRTAFGDWVIRGCRASSTRASPTSSRRRTTQWSDPSPPAAEERRTL